MARRVSPVPMSGIVPSTAPVAGLVTSHVPPPSASRHCPPTRPRVRSRSGSDSASAEGGGEAFVLMLRVPRSEEHTSELQSLMRISYAVFCLKKKKFLQETKPSNQYKAEDTTSDSHAI